MSRPLLLNPREGMELVGLVKHLNQDKINRFAGVSGGTSLIHLDPDFAEKTRFRSTVAHGILLLAYISEMMKNNFGPPWFTSGDMDVRFVGPAKPGDTLVGRGEILRIETVENRSRVSCSVRIENHRGEKVAEGQTQVSWELRESKGANANK